MAMVRFRGLTALLAWAQLVTVHGADCLSTVDVIPANQRVDLSLNGQRLPIGFSGAVVFDSPYVEEIQQGYITNRGSKHYLEVKNLGMTCFSPA